MMTAGSDSSLARDIGVSVRHLQGASASCLADVLPGTLVQAGCCGSFPRTSRRGSRVTRRRMPRLRRCAAAKG